MTQKWHSQLSFRPTKQESNSSHNEGQEQSQFSERREDSGTTAAWNHLRPQSGLHVACVWVLGVGGCSSCSGRPACSPMHELECVSKPQSQQCGRDLLSAALLYHWCTHTGPISSSNLLIHRPLISSVPINQPIHKQVSLFWCCCLVTSLQ